MESEEIKILKNTLRDITGNGVNGRLARDYAPRNVISISYKIYTYLYFYVINVNEYIFIPF